MIPVGDYPNPPRAQWVTRFLIGINVAVYLFITAPMQGRVLTVAEHKDREIRAALDEMWTDLYAEEAAKQNISRQAWETRGVSAYDVFIFRFGYRPSSPSLVGLLFCMFLHAGFSHLAGNMLFLWIYGDNVEYRLGPVAYFCWYMATGIAATLTFAFLDSASSIPLVGASGAISGVLGFYLLWFPHNYVKVFFFFPFFGIIPIKAAWILGIYLVIDNIVPMIAAQGGSVAHGAHVGGFVAGLAVAYAYNLIKGTLPSPHPDRFEPYRPGTPGHGRKSGPAEPAWKEAPAPEPASAPERAPADATGTFESAIQAGRMEDAAHAFARINRKGGSPPAADSVFRLAQWLYAESFVHDAASVFRYYVKRYPRGEDLDRVHLGLGVLLSRMLGNPAAARDHLLQAIDMTDTPAIADTAREELARIDD